MKHMRYQVLIILATLLITIAISKLLSKELDESAHQILLTSFALIFGGTFEFFVLSESSRRKDRISIKIINPPGMYVSRILGFIYSEKVKERIFDAILSDMHEEYYQALDSLKVWKARWIHARGILNIIIASVSQLTVSMLKLVLDIWKIS